jgi:hypothetical protein
MSEFVMDRIARAEPNVVSAFQHRFGGSSAHRGVVPRGNSQPLHLLYTFDTTDPSFPIHLPKARFLPLYYCFPYNGGGVGYRIVSDEEIEILSMETNRVERDFPYENYPDTFPETPISLAPISYEEHKTLVYYLYCQDNYLEEECLSDKDRQFIEQSGYPFTQLGGIQRMWQDIPDVFCPNKQCDNHKSRDSMDVFAVVWNQPVQGIYLWDDDAEYESNTQLIFQICSLCHSIHACNRCT